MAKQVAVTQRAYTLRLRGVDPQDQSWREALWRTHDAVNKGAKAFGDWLLTLRGGLDHALADAKVKGGKGKPDRDPTDEERKGRRILLALSWLSVESEKGAPDRHVVPHDLDKQSGTRSNWKTVDALKKILKGRGLGESEIESWVQDCSASLTAAIRGDAVWVNRSKAFDAACNGQDRCRAREDARTLLWYLLTDDYLVLPKKPEKKQPEAADQEEDESDVDAAAEAVAKSGKGAGQRTRHPFSHVFGRGNTQGFGKPVRTLNLRDHWQKHLKPLVEAAGIPLTDPNTKARKGAPPSPTELHREMFSKAASRLAQIWTKQKQQEVARQLRTAADDELKQLESDQAYREALDRLDAYCRERGQAAGSLEEYRINPRAVEGWERVVAAWGKINETDSAKAAEKRVDEVKRLQDEDAEKKFGDVNLFISLAEPEYEPVWRHDGQVDASFLKTYVKGWKARVDAVRLKVSAFRHPDPFFHPVFCQFGVSRPPIKYSRLDNNDPGDARMVQMRLWRGGKAEDVQLLAVSKRFDAEIGSVARPTGTASLNVPKVARRSRLGIAAIAEQSESDTFCVAHVFDQQAVRSRQKTDEDGTQDETDIDESQNKKKKPTWNGTLQADRRDLEVIGRLESVDSRKAEVAKQHLRWWLIVSLELQPTGPWYDYIANLADQSPFLRTVRRDENKGEKRKQGTKYISWSGWPHDEINKPLRENKEHTALVADPTSERKGMAALILSRLPGLRVLSVDLGHRYAAACAVWETLAKDAFEKECRDAEANGAKVVLGPEGCKPDEALYVHVVWPEKESNAATKKARAEGRAKFRPVTVYRRIGAAGGVKTVSHPGPWARLNRQFLIKLQGEDEEARGASNEEIWAVHQLEAELGRTVPLIDWLVKAGWGKTDKQKTRLNILRSLGWTPASGGETSGKPDDDEGEARKPSLSVDELMSSAVRTVRLALKRHGDRARIAFAMTAAYKPMPGDRKYHFDVAKDASANDDEKTRRGRHIQFLQDALSLWHDLFSSRGWKDDVAKALWDRHIATLKGYQTPEEIAENLASVERKKKRRENRDKLRAAAEALAANDQLRKELRASWENRWKVDDGVPADVDKKTGRKIKDGTGWHARLRRLQDWLMPPAKRGEKVIRRVGGLSLTRLATLTEFRRKVQVAFFTRLHPVGTKTEAKESFGQSTLDTLEHLREQRVKQLASRIAEAALGIGRMKRPRGGKDPKRPRARVDQPCHAVVIENLTHYRPEETRTRRENRQLMTWSSSKVKKYLAEACQLNGLHLREVQAGYTSRQDSRTGAPGIRCQDVPVADFVRQGGYLWKRIKKALEEVKEKKDKASAENDLIAKLYDRWDDKAKIWTAANGYKWTFGQNGRWSQRDGTALDPTKPESPAAVRIPQRGGEIFVSADAESPAAKGLQADLNAAANIGLKALTDPDWPGKWWYVPAVLDNGGWRIPKADRCSGATCLTGWRVAAGNSGVYSRGGAPLSIGDDESVKRAEEAAKKAKEAWETVKKQTKAARKVRATVSLEAAEAQENEAKSAHDQAKKSLSDAKKAASAKECINLWRDVCSTLLGEGEWREWPVYKPWVEHRVVDILSDSAGFTRDPGER